MLKRSSDGDAYFNQPSKWHDELIELRKIVLQSGLNEEIKWSSACYDLSGKNIAVIHKFKDYFALMFMKGSLMKDPARVLVQQTENVQARRQIRFENLQDVRKLEQTVKNYLQEAIEIEKVGLEPEMKSIRQFAVPEEFVRALDEVPNLRDSFESLTPGRQRGYLLYFSGAKQAKTRQDRISKYIPKILSGMGLDD